MRAIRMLSLALGALILTVGSASAEPRVSIASGVVESAARDGLTSFLGIPYAAPPLGPLRWKPPAPAPRWKGVRSARLVGPACPQPERGDGLGGGRADLQSEDCLTLNVWAPQGGERLPVMVWIHGGAHRIGSGGFAIYDGAALARQGVVVVTLNYRLGALGYFAHPSLTREAPASEPLGNYGMMDQVAALEWVHGNIARFGGDPGAVTVFGQSAGGASILYLLASHRAEGLFHRAIVQSGGGFQSADSLGQRETAGVRAASALGLRENASAAELRAIPAEQWVDALGSLAMRAPTGPFVDGRLVQEPPMRAFAERRVHDVPLLIGFNDNEASVMGALGIRGDALPVILGDRYEAFRALYGSIADAEFQRRALGDLFFGAPALWIALKTADGAPTFLYHFTYVPERRRGASQGAGHGGEIPFVFQTWDRLPIPADFLSGEDRSVSALVSSCWTSFARGGAPTCAPAPTWPQFDDDGRSVMWFSTAPSVNRPPREEAMTAALSFYEILLQ